jgi:hypothetical protein
MAIIYGSLVTLCGICGVVFMAASGTMEMPGNDPAAAQLQKKMQEAVQEALLRDAPGYQAIQIVGPITSLGAALALLVGGIGLMGMRRWARTLALVCCLIAIANTLFQTAYQIAYVLPITRQVIDVDLPAALPPGGGPQADQVLKFAQIMQDIVAVAMVALNVILVIYLLVIIFLLRKRHVRAAFAAQEIGGSAERPLDEERRWGDDEDSQDWNQPR